jgi:UDP-N-acetyl-D-galactosamine dehydrogenase
VDQRIVIIGLGYVGLPLALAFARKFPGVVGFDMAPGRVKDLRACHDRNGDVPESELEHTSLLMTADPDDLQGADFFVVAVPTPVDRVNNPDLSMVLGASKIVGGAIRPGSIVVYESTFYPGLTEEVCGPVLSEASGLKQGVDFKLGYSPERVNPGDREHTLEKVVKVVSAEDAETLETVSRVYEAVIETGIHRAASIKVAEAAKVIENVQRDLNIALMNELALIFDRLDIRTKDVLEAASTKWNFLQFSPGLVGGHCVGVDPYYLTAKAEELGYHPQVILAGRRINDGMGVYVAQRTVKLLINAGLPVKRARVGVMGLTFKENVADLRNSRVPDIVAELEQFGVSPLVHDPLASPEEADREYGIQLASWSEMKDLDAVICAVSHDEYRETFCKGLSGIVRPEGVLVDVRSVVNHEALPDSLHYWSL